MVCCIIQAFLLLPSIVAGNDHLSFSLPLTDPPSIMKMSNQTMAVGQTISITCQVSANPQPNQYSWAKVGDGTFNQTGPVLTIRNIQLHHAGTYRCTAANTMTPTTGIQEQGIDTMNVTINVQKCKYYFHLKWISSCGYKVFPVFWFFEIVHGSALPFNHTRGIWKVMNIHPYNSTQWSKKKDEGIIVNVRIWGFWECHV